MITQPGAKGYRRLPQRSKAKRHIARRPVQSSGIITRYNGSMNTFNVFPNHKMVSLKYCQTVNFTSGIGGLAGTENIFRLNGMFDPDFTGVGHQPYGHDELATLYRFYRVMGVTVTVDFVNMSGPGTVGWAMLQTPKSTWASNGINPDALREKPGSVMGMPNWNSSNRCTIDFGYRRISEISGVTEAQVENDDEYAALFGADAFQTPFLRVNLADLSGASGATAAAQVTIVYHTKVYGRKTEASS